MSDFAKARFPALAPQQPIRARTAALPVPNLPWGELMVAGLMLLLLLR